MLSFPAAIKVYLCTVACDLRRYADSRTMPNRFAERQVGRAAMDVNRHPIRHSPGTDQRLFRNASRSSSGR